MSNHERALLVMMRLAGDNTTRAVLLQSYIAECGPLSEEAAAEARKLLLKEQGHAT